MTALFAALVFIIIAIIKYDESEVRTVLLVLASVLIGSFITMESWHTHYITRTRRERDAEREEEDDRGREGRGDG